MSCIFIITGKPASGKTTFAQELSKQLNVPVFSKDLLKVSLSEHLAINNRGDSRTLSRATVSAMYFIAARMIETGNSFILEANFRQYEGDRIQKLISMSHYKTVIYLFGGDSRILGKRFVEREYTDERHMANRVFEVSTNYDDYIQLFQEYEEFKLPGKMISVDTTSFERVNFQELINDAKMELHETD